jgi:hypothetical protein
MPEQPSIQPDPYDAAFGIKQTGYNSPPPTPFSQASFSQAPSTPVNNGFIAPPAINTGGDSGGGMDLSKMIPMVMSLFA